MTNDTHVEDGGPPTLEDIRQSAKEMRRILRILRAGGTGTASIQDVADFAMAQLHTCAFEGWQPPDQLILLLGELLEEPDRKQPKGVLKHRAAQEKHPGDCPVCAPVPDTSVDDDRLELHRAHDTLWPRVEAAIVGVNIVGLPGFNAAAAFEAGYPAHTDNQILSSASIARIAKAAGASRSSVKRWRAMRSYRYLLNRLRGHR
jgi:hypothetical protein